MNSLKQSKKQLEKLERLKQEQLNQDEKFMKMAIKQAKLALNAGEIPVGCVIVKNGKVIARAQNKKERKNCCVYHAEMLAIMAASKKLGWRLDGCEIYVTLEPCLMCAGAIVSARIDRVIFGMNENKSGAFESREELFKNSGLNHKTQVVSGVLEAECRKIWESFFKQKRTNSVK